MSGNVVLDLRSKISLEDSSSLRLTFNVLWSTKFYYDKNNVGANACILSCIYSSYRSRFLQFMNWTSAQLSLCKAEDTGQMTVTFTATVKITVTCSVTIKLAVTFSVTVKLVVTFAVTVKMAFNFCCHC